MLKYIIKRLLWMIPVILGVLIIVFILSEITPGDPVDNIVGSDATEEAREAAREAYGFNDPAVVRFFRYLKGIVLHGDLGTSYTNGQSVFSELKTRFPITIKLTLLSVALALVVALPLGVISAVKQYSWIDNVTMFAALFFVSVPQFWMALMMLLIFSVKMHILPASASDLSNPLAWIMPVAMIGLNNVGNLARVTRSSMLEIIRQDYIRTAKAKGQKNGVVIIKHGLRNALIPVIANVGNTIGVSLGGAVVAESIFSIPGVGQYMLNAISNRNWPSVQGGIVMLALAFSIVMLLVDLIYTFVDPRLKSEFEAKNKIVRKKREEAA